MADWHLGCLARWRGGKASGMTDTVVPMSVQQEDRADHTAYITAVSASIEARDIRVTDLLATTAEDGRREASLMLRPDIGAFAEQIPGRATASWDEENGWSLLMAGDAVAARVHKGLSVLPDPEDVAAWAVVLVTHTELTPSRENHPLRDHTVADPAFEAQLARYAPGT